MKRTLHLVAIMAAAAALNGQDKVTVPLTDPSRPALIHAHQLSGSITVTGYAGKEVIVETARSRGRSNQNPRPAPRADGMRRIDMSAAGLSVEEQDNVVRIGTSIHNDSADLSIQVPFTTNLKLGAVNSGRIVVERVNGEIDVNNVNGAVVLTNVSGVVVAHALNGELTVSLDKVAGDKPMSFSTLNGDIDVTLPPDVKAKVKLKSDNGDMFTDFDIQLDASRKPVIEEGRRGGKYRVQIDRAFTGTINGGGPDMQFTTMNGKIYIRKKK